MARVEMENQNESHAAVSGHLGEELLERLQSARRSADANNERFFLFALNNRSEIFGRSRLEAFFLSWPCGWFFLFYHRLRSLHTLRLYLVIDAE